MTTRNEIINTLQMLKLNYNQEGLRILGFFGSYARENENEYSDVDIAYQIDHKKFSKHYQDGFSKLLRIEAIKDEIKALLHTPIDLVPDTNKKIIKEIVYV